MQNMKECRLCPRNCMTDRSSGQKGVCGQSDKLRLARAALHMWEEPCITGTNGSGTVFFSGCSLHCVFCQNHQIANGEVGKEVSISRLSDIFLSLQEKGAENINLVTGDHFVPQIVNALDAAKKNGLVIPVVYNTSSYLHVDTLRMLEGYVDIYLPDFKYYSSEISFRYAKTKDYSDMAKAAISEMVRQTKEPVFYDKKRKILLSASEYNDLTSPDNVIMKRGTIVRHLILPEGLKDSKRIIRWLLEKFGDEIYISIMNQYTPMGTFPEMPELNRRVTSEEYEIVLEDAIAHGIENGFLQEGESADESFIPPFDYEGI